MANSAETFTNETIVFSLDFLPKSVIAADKKS